MTKFPLCEELGLTIETRYILAADLERLKVAEAEILRQVRKAFEWAEIETYKIKEKNLIENWGEANAEIERLNALAKENERLKNALEQTIDNAHETATLLAKENERLAKIQQDDESEKYKYMDERDQLNTELLNTKELSSKLVEENAALKSMCEKLAVALKPWASVESDCGDDFSGVHEGVILRVECIAGNIHDAREALAEWKEFKK